MRSVIFDFDGTIGDSFKVIIEIGNDLTKNNLVLGSAEVERLRSMGLSEIAKEMGIKKYRWPLLMYRGRKQMTKRLGEVKPFNGLSEVLSTLRKEGFKIYIVSSNSKKNIQLFLSENGLSGYIDDIYGSVGMFGKARILTRVLKKNDIDYSEVVYVGDEPRDIEASKDANIACIAVGWGFISPDVLAREAPMVLVRNPEQLLKAIEAWSSV